jgi:hypothetical protein
MSDASIPFDSNITEDSAAPRSESTNRTAALPERDQLELMLENAEYLLSYAIEAGIELDPELTQRIIAARRVGSMAFDGAEGGALAAAISKLAARLHPVTAETLRACRDDADDAIRSYKRIALGLAVFIIPLSMISFIYTAISNSITPDLKAANDLTVALHTQLDAIDDSRSPPPGSVTALQQYAATTRAIYAHAVQLSRFAPYIVSDPFQGSYDRMQLRPDLKTTDANAVRQEVNEKTKVYQEVRLFATSIQDAASVIWGAVGACILPVLYALLGACAYVLRCFTDQVEKRTFAVSYTTAARFIIAGIGGMVVGLFSNFTIGQGASLSPLAIAFLVGYAVDVFFSFLEGSMQNLRVGSGQGERRRAT